jgi:hypothetical protein
MTQTLTEWLQRSRLMVVEVDPVGHRLRVKDADERCTELSCGERALVVFDEGAHADLTALYPGDTIKMESTPGGADRIVVVRRAWEENASPEL